MCMCMYMYTMTGGEESRDPRPRNDRAFITASGKYRSDARAHSIRLLPTTQNTEPDTDRTKTRKREGPSFTSPPSTPSTPSTYRDAPPGTRYPCSADGPRPFHTCRCPCSSVGSASGGPPQPSRDPVSPVVPSERAPSRTRIQPKLSRQT